MTEPQEQHPASQPLGPEGDTGRNLPQPYLPLEAPTALQRYQRPLYGDLEEEAVSLEHYLEILLRRKWLVGVGLCSSRDRPVTGLEIMTGGPPGTSFS